MSMVFTICPQRGFFAILLYLNVDYLLADTWRGRVAKYMQLLVKILSLNVNECRHGDNEFVSILYLFMALITLGKFFEII